MMRTFHEWLRAQHGRADAIGDLARDVRADPDWPQAYTLEEFEQHLTRRGTFEGEHAALRLAWAEWRRMPTTEEP